MQKVLKLLVTVELTYPLNPELCFRFPMPKAGSQSHTKPNFISLRLFPWRLLTLGLFSWRPLSAVGTFDKDESFTRANLNQGVALMIFRQM